jgi:hypothetical protein
LDRLIEGDQRTESHGMAQLHIGEHLEQSNYNFSGFRTFGLPLAYMMLVEGGWRLVEEQA